MKRVVFAAFFLRLRRHSKLPKSEDMHPRRFLLTAFFEIRRDFTPTSVGATAGKCLPAFFISSPASDPDSPYPECSLAFPAAFLDSTHRRLRDGEQTVTSPMLITPVLANILACEASQRLGRSSTSAPATRSLNQVLQMLQKASGKTLETKIRDVSRRDSAIPSPTSACQGNSSVTSPPSFRRSLERTYAGIRLTTQGCANKDVVISRCARPHFAASNFVCSFSTIPSNPMLG